MSFEMYVGAKEQRKEVLEVIKKALTENGFEKFANNFIANKRDGKAYQGVRHRYRSAPRRKGLRPGQAMP